MSFRGGKIMKIFLIFIMSSLSFVFFFHPGSTVASTKKALLIGINKYKHLPFYSQVLKTTVNNLKGSVNDVKIMKGLLKSHYGFLEDNIKTIYDEEATKDNILKIFENWLIDSTKEGDLVFFYFSGHGTQVPDQNGDEEDGQDEGLCAHDLIPEGANSANEAKIILDDELGQWLRRLRGREVIVVIDSCHSGTATRGVNGRIVSYLEETPSKHAKFIPVRLNPTRGKSLNSLTNIPKQNDIPEGQIFFYSSKENQLSYEIALPSGFHGAFTSLLAEMMNRKKNVTYLELFEYAQKEIKDRHKLDQDPQIEPMDKKILKRQVFTLPFPPPKPSSTLADPEPSVQIQQEIKPPEVSYKPEPPTPPEELKKEQILLRIEPLKGGRIGIIKILREKLKAYPYIEFTEGTFFDRLLRGEVKNNLYYIRLLNRIGDTITIPSTQNIDSLVKSIASQLEIDFIVKQLARIRHPNPPFKVRVWITDEKRRDFKIGEKIIFNFQSEKDCYLLMLNIDSQGNFHVIFPNQFYKENRVTGGKIISIPDEKMGKQFELQFGEPVGEEIVKVIATLEPLKLEELGIDKFKQLFTLKGMFISEQPRAIYVVQKINETLSANRFIWSEDTVVIRSYK